MGSRTKHTFTGSSSVSCLYLSDRSLTRYTTLRPFYQRHYTTTSVGRTTTVPQRRLLGLDSCTYDSYVCKVSLPDGTDKSLMFRPRAVGSEWRVDIRVPPTSYLKRSTLKGTSTYILTTYVGEVRGYPFLFILERGFGSFSLL